MIGFDTNVLVRLLTEDEPTQATQAIALLQRAKSEGEQLFLSDLVLMETVWVLQRSYRIGRSEIADVLVALLENAAFVIEGREVVETALRSFIDGRADFADCLIAAKNTAAGCTHTVSFDKLMQRLSSVEPL